MKKLALLLLTFTLSVIPQAYAGDNDDSKTFKQTAERDPFQLPADVRTKGLANELNKLAPAAGSAEDQY